MALGSTLWAYRQKPQDDPLFSLRNGQFAAVLFSQPAFLEQLEGHRPILICTASAPFSPSWQSF